MANNHEESINIEIIYATKNEQKLFYLTVNKNITVEAAIKQCGILDRYPEIDLTINKVGIFSQVCQLDDKLNDNDRIEIYRPLLIDPKEARKQRALKNKK